MKGAFITATGTGVGKTWVASALAAACVQRGKRVAAIKPIETGVDPDPRDALSLLGRLRGADQVAGRRPAPETRRQVEFVMGWTEG